MVVYCLGCCWLLDQLKEKENSRKKKSPRRVFGGRNSRILFSGKNLFIGGDRGKELERMEKGETASETGEGEKSRAKGRGTKLKNTCARKEELLVDGTQRKLICLRLVGRTRN